MSRCLEIDPVKIKTAYINHPTKIEMADRNILTGKLIQIFKDLDYWTKTYLEASSNGCPLDVSLDLAYCERQDFDRKIKLLNLLEGWHP